MDNNYKPSEKQLSSTRLFHWVIHISEDGNRILLPHDFSFDRTFRSRVCPDILGTNCKDIEVCCYSFQTFIPINCPRAPITFSIIIDPLSFHYLRFVLLTSSFLKPYHPSCKQLKLVWPCFIENRNLKIKIRVVLINVNSRLQSYQRQQ